MLKLRKLLGFGSASDRTASALAAGGERVTRFIHSRRIKSALQGVDGPLAGDTALAPSRSISGETCFEASHSRLPLRAR